MDSITLLRILSRVDKLKLRVIMFFLLLLNIKYCYGTVGKVILAFHI